MNSRNRMYTPRPRLRRNVPFFSIILVIIIFVFATQLIQNEPDQNQSGEFLGILQVSFINVGQGDSILIKNPQNEFMLIDTGSGDQYDILKSYLDNQNVEKFEYVIFTHPHADHIGSADKIVKEYDIECLIMPRATNTTNTFLRLLGEIEAKNMVITTAEARTVGKEYIFGDAKFLIVAPVKDEYENINNYSVVIKMFYGDNSFVFTGDMEKNSEDDIIDKFGGDISADVLKIGHHGSSTSSSQKFLNLVKPQIAVILSDGGKSYGHPHADALERITNTGAQILRSDLHGTIVISSNGQTLDIKTEITP